MATRASSSSPYFLRVADASAASSASKMISLSTPFSFETASTTIRISLFTTIHLHRSPHELRGKLCLADFIPHHAHRLLIHHQRKPFIVHRGGPAGRPAPACLARDLQFHPDTLAHETLEVRAGAQHPIEPRRGHL